MKYRVRKPRNRDHWLVEESRYGLFWSRIQVMREGLTPVYFANKEPAVDYTKWVINERNPPIDTVIETKEEIIRFYVMQSSGERLK